MSYATIKDLRKIFEKAISESKYHIAITIEDEGLLQCFTYGQGISDNEMISVLKELKGNK